MLQVQQGGADWQEARLGKVTASRVHAVLFDGRGAETYAREVVTERLTAERANSFQTAAMQWGLNLEADARRLYERMRVTRVDLVGFIDHPSIQWSGCSPDGLVSNCGLIEIKCPQPQTHLRFLQSQKIQPRYLSQMQWQLACTGRDWVDFLSYDPRAEKADRLAMVRVHRDEAYISRLERAVIRFLENVEKQVRHGSGLHAIAPVSTDRQLPPQSSASQASRSTRPSKSESTEDNIWIWIVIGVVVLIWLFGK